MYQKLNAWHSFLNLAFSNPSGIFGATLGDVSYSRPYNIDYFLFMNQFLMNKINHEKCKYANY
jgi:hypothetical protein